MLSLVLAPLFLQQTPDPRLGHATRTDQAGWIEAHLEGKPRDVGYQYGYLLAPEIDAAHKARINQIGTGKYDWNLYRETAKKLFWEKTDREYQEEMAGQADGLQAKGFK